jgi:tight adherence protein B
MPAPISVEFRRVLRETELGRPLPDALATMLSRVPSPDLMLFTSAVAIQHRVGGDLAQIFRGISHTIRERLRVRGETKVLTSQARYSSYIIAGLPVALFAFLWFTNYEYLANLFLPGLTRLLFGGAIMGIFVGFYAMNKIATVDV